MAEKGSPTPERELLKLIEEPTSSVKKSTVKIKRNLFGWFSPLVLKSKLSFLKTNFRPVFSFQHLAQLEIRTINRSLIIFIVVLVLYLIFSFVFSLAGLKKKSNLALEVKKAASDLVLPQASALKSSSYYLGKARARDIFKMGLTKAVSAKQTKEESSFDIEEAAAKLKLVGISWSKDPDVMIENTMQRRAYFLKRGMLIGNLEVKAIFKDKVILSYGSQEIELR